MDKFQEACQKGDNNKIISSLIELRKLSKMNEIDTNTFESLVNLIKVPNTKVINYTLSILANCCLNNNFRHMFKEMGGIPHLVLVLRTIDNDSIICRACRLIGNLALSSDLAKDLGVHNAGEALLQLLEKFENLSSDTIIMAFRALKKLWTGLKQLQVMPDFTLSTFNKCLNSEDEQVVYLTLESLVLLTQLKTGEKKNKFKVNKQLFLKIIELSKTEKFNHLSIACLSNIICYQSSHIWSYLEGSNIAEVFIDYFQKVDDSDTVVFRAFQRLCSEAVIRNKVKVAGLLPRLVEMWDAINVRKILWVLHQFQYDTVSVMICSQNPKFTSILINHVLLPEAVQLLNVVSRLNPPVMELVTNESLNVIINTRDCRGILKTIIRTKEFLKPILLSGMVWRIDEAISMEDVGSIGHSEGLIIHLLSSGEMKQREEVSLAVPFLVKPRQFEILYKLLVHYQVIKTILHLLQENPLEEKILASIIRLIKIFRCNYHQSDNFFQDLVKWDNDVCLNSEDANLNSGVVEDQSATQVASGGNSEVAWVTFELDDETCVVLDKNILCRNSPVLDSMLNGYFMEAGQETVKLRCCSGEALIYLVKLLRGEMELLSKINIQTYLELLSLTDRFLLMNLNNVLTANLKIDENSCPLVYQWYRKAGYTKNLSIVRQKTYEFIFSSSENLLLVMRNEFCRIALVNEISNYLNNSLVDLL